ncbi:hypothetical protein BDY24DRAFT_398806 [Mrakia frigida]|uniref:uncharacterized protein n=1 Tax=Mrakia frigida TaxID=29902 RepID=UPI003FCC0331
MGGGEDEEEEEEEELSADDFEFGLDGFGDLEVVSYEDECSHVMINTIPYQNQNESAPTTAGLNSSGRMSQELDDLLAEMEVVGSRSRRSFSGPGDASLPRTVSPPHDSFEERSHLHESYQQQLAQSTVPTHVRQPSEHDFEAGSPRPHFQPTLTLHRNASLASTTTSFSTMSSPSPSPVAHRSTNHTHGGSLVLKTIAEAGGGRRTQSSSLSMLQPRSTTIRAEPNSVLSASAPTPTSSALRPLALLQQPKQTSLSNSMITKSNAPTSKETAPVRALLGETDENFDPSSSERTTNLPRESKPSSVRWSGVGEKMSATSLTFGGGSRTGVVAGPAWSARPIR